MIIENVFPPIPSEVIMPLAGFMTAENKLSFVGVVIAGTTGSVIGNLGLYYVGWKIGGERLKRWAGRHGRWLMLSSDDIERAKGWFQRHGAAAVFLFRLVPGIRSLISIPAGIEQMNPMLFLLLSACGTGIWAGVLAYLGRMLGENYESVDAYLRPLGYVIFSSLVIWYVAHVVRRSRSRSI
ncbi:MAG TPA: DedA family protein [Candidatus Binatia bacterium]|nr:DedA family protein [Candidatus Binatia bacterium]